MMKHVVVHGTVLVINDDSPLSEEQLNIAVANIENNATLNDVATLLQCKKMDIKRALFSIALAIPARRMTKVDKEKIKQLVKDKTAAMQAIILNTSLHVVNNTRRQLKISLREPYEQSSWTNEEDNFIRLHALDMSRRQLAQALHKTENNIRVRLVQLGFKGTKANPIRKNGWQAPGTYEDRCKKRGGWTDEQITYVKAHAGEQTLEQIATAINKMGAHKELCTIGRMVKHYGLQSYGSLHGYRPRGRSYTDTERRFMLDNWQRLSIHEMAAVMANGISAKNVRLFLEQNGITKGRLTHSLPEYTAMAMLRAHNVQFKAFTRIPLVINGQRRRREVDLLVDGKLAVEVQGDYWHGNPVTNKTLNAKQRYQQKIDAAKKDALVNAGYAYIALWEHDLVNNPAYAEHQLCTALMQAKVHGDQLTTLAFANNDTLLANVKRQFANDKTLRAVLDNNRGKPAANPG